MSLHNRITEKNSVLGAITFILKKETRGASLNAVRVILRYFFIPQFERKFGFTKTPIVHVDHMLDDTIPFSPHYVKLYLSFTKLWIKSLLFSYREFGKRSLPEIREYINSISELYVESSKVYFRCMSTTERPRKVGGFYFKVIHLFDPHLLCLPSLHVEIVNFNFYMMSGMIEKLADKPETYGEEMKYLWGQAVSITESILFIKQHSVNCIAAGLYILSSGSCSFPESLAGKVIEDMFTGKEDQLESAPEVKQYIRELYEKFISEGKSKPYYEVLESFLLSYDAEKAGFRDRAS
jgi:hypothetical protein